MDNPNSKKEKVVFQNEREREIMTALWQTPMGRRESPRLLRMMHREQRRIEAEDAANAQAQARQPQPQPQTNQNEAGPSTPAPRR